MTTRKYLSCADTAKLIRQALKEAFPSIQFSVRSSNYSGGASIRVVWTDGPTVAQVEPIAGAFAGSYFDGMIDYKGSNYHELDGQPVRFGADYVFCTRKHSDALLGHALEVVARSYGGAVALSPQDFRNGAGHYWRSSGGCELGQAVYRYLAGDVDGVCDERHVGLEPLPSRTLARLRFAGDDGYGAGTVGRDGSGRETSLGYPRSA